jgi:hypothetical protein
VKIIEAMSWMWGNNGVEKTGGVRSFLWWDGLVNANTDLRGIVIQTCGLLSNRSTFKKFDGGWAKRNQADMTHRHIRRSRSARYIQKGKEGKKREKT